ncbi:MAG: ABC transporter ATP-binding protein [Lacunisphaera sp.]
MSEPVISISGLGKRYHLSHEKRRDTLRDSLTHRFRRLLGASGAAPDGEEFWALRDVSFDVQQGDVIGIIGRNGAGKSTLLKILSRITEPTTGRITLRGRIASLLEVGTGFHPELSGRENIFLNGAILGMARVEIARKFDEIVAFAEIERFLDTAVKHYSSGMYMRLAFAVAAHLEPEILIVDEVLAVGDAQFQKKCLGKMQDVATREGRTVLFVSHNMAAVDQLCNRCVYLMQGTVHAVGPTAPLLQQYLATQASGAGTLKAVRQHPDVEVTGVDVLVDGRSARGVTAGSTVEFVLNYRCPRPAAFPSGFEASFIVFGNGQKLANFWSNAGRGATFSAGPAGRISCRVPRWPFRAMSIDLEVHLNYRLSNLIEIPGAVQFDSLDGDFYGRGAIPHSAEGILLLDHRWDYSLTPDA